jgi:cytochrome c
MTLQLRPLLTALSASLFVSSTGALAQPSPEARGEALVSRHCAMCHAIGRSGTSPHSQAPPLRILGQRYPPEALEEALAEGLLSGHPDMPEFVFAPRDVGAIVRYLRSIQEK